jgi:hypothetical protein
MQDARTASVTYLPASKNYSAADHRMLPLMGRQMLLDLVNDQGAKPLIENVAMCQFASRDR